MKVGAKGDGVMEENGAAEEREREREGGRERIKRTASVNSRARAVFRRLQLGVPRYFYTRALTGRALRGQRA